MGDNALITQEIMHHMHKMKGNEGYMIFKIDSKKAYDHVDWNLLELTLFEFGFLQPIIQIIMNNTLHKLIRLNSLRFLGLSSLRMGTIKIATKVRLMLPLVKALETSSKISLPTIS